VRGRIDGTDKVDVEGEVDIGFASSMCPGLKIIINKYLKKKYYVDIQPEIQPEAV
jgi:hypothetical protein